MARSVIGLRWPALLAVAVLLTGLACQRSGKRVIGVVPKSTSNLFWVSVRSGVDKAAIDFDVEIEWNGAPAETDYTRQIQIVDSMTARHVDGIALAAAEENALIQAVDRAVKAGIPVTIFDSGLASDNFMSFVATDNYAAGALGADTLAAMIGGKGKVGMMMHAPGSVSTMDRERGFEETVREKYPNIEIIKSQFGMADRAKSRAAAENLLTANPDVTGMFASSEPSTEGASLALKARNLSDQITFIGFDSSEAMIEDLRSGVLDGFLVQDPFRMGYEAVKTIVDKLDGTQPPKRLDLEATVVNRDNLDNPEIQQLLHPAGVN